MSIILENPVEVQTILLRNLMMPSREISPHQKWHICMEWP